MSNSNITRQELRQVKQALKAIQSLEKLLHEIRKNRRLPESLNNKDVFTVIRDGSITLFQVIGTVDIDDTNLESELDDDSWESECGTMGGDNLTPEMFEFAERIGFFSQSVDKSNVGR